MAKRKLKAAVLVPRTVQAEETRKPKQRPRKLKATKKTGKRKLKAKQDLNHSQPDLNQPQPDLNFTSDTNAILPEEEIRRPNTIRIHEPEYGQVTVYPFFKNCRLQY